METGESKEKLPMLSEKEALEVLFWSFFYSQGVPELHKRILNWIRRSYEIDDAFKKRLMHKAIGLDEKTGTTIYSDTFDLPEEQLERYRKFVSGEHRRNTEGNLADFNITDNINLVVGELVEPDEFTGESLENILQEIFIGMVQQDYANVVLAKTRTQSQALDYVLGPKRAMGPAVFATLMKSLSNVAKNVLADENFLITVNRGYNSIFGVEQLRVRDVLNKIQEIQPKASS